METRNISQVVWREDLYPRIDPSAAKIQEYAENIDLLPPIEVNQDNILIDGYHRWRAHQTAKREEIQVIVTETQSEEKLLMLAIERNATHGLQLSSADKKRYALRWWDVMNVGDICATLAISETTFFRWTQNKRDQQEKEIKEEIISRWLRCETQEAIAEAVRVSQPHVAKIAENITESQMGDGDIFRNFETSAS